MGNMVTNVSVKFHYDWLCIDKALGNFQKCDNSNNNKNNIRSTWGPFPSPIIDPKLFSIRRV